jgi:hypothetical protein
MESIIDQLRVQDGKLFHNELVLSVYLDLKRLVLNHVLLAVSAPGGLKTFLEWSDELEEELVSRLLITDELFEAALDVFCTEVHKSRKAFRRGQMLKSMFLKICTDPCVVSKQIVTLDPIKQDFVMRETFRRSLLEGASSEQTAQQQIQQQVSHQPAEQQLRSVGVLEEPVEESPPEDEEALAPLPISQDARTLISKVPDEATILPDTISLRQDTASVASSRTHKKPVVRRIIFDNDDATTVFTASRK